MKVLISILFVFIIRCGCDAQILKKLGGELKDDARWRVRVKANQKMDQALDTIVAQPKKIKEKRKIKAGQNTSANDQSQLGGTPIEKVKTRTTVHPAESNTGGNILGDWKLTLETYDNNHNKVLDDDERKKAFSSHYFYRFNPDGSCLINFTTSAKGAFKGHYISSEQNGKKKIMIYMDEGGKSEVQGGYTVISANNNEMVLLESTGDHTFWIFKKA